MFITKKHIPPRKLLQGIGATLALPLLDSIVPFPFDIRPDGAGF
jgi:hypothetical protein